MAREADNHIRVTDDVWSDLNARKKPGDSFNDVITRLLEDGDDPSGDDDPVETDGGKPVFAD